MRDFVASMVVIAISAAVIVSQVTPAVPEPTGTANIAVKLAAQDRLIVELWSRVEALEAERDAN